MAIEGDSIARASGYLRVLSRGDRGAMIQAPAESPWPVHFGIGMWGAVRFGRDFERLLRLIQRLDPWHRFICMDGYGFKFGFFDFAGNQDGVAHLRTIPGYYRRAAIQGLGRALFFVFRSDRRGLFEAVGELAPESDADVIEGVAFSAAYVECDQPRQAVNFARAVPYEWRAHAHLGLTLGYRARRQIDADYLARCLVQLPERSREVLEHAMTLADSLEQQFRTEHPVAGYGLWRETLCRQLEQERLWEPVYVDANQDDRAGNRNIIH